MKGKQMSAILVILIMLSGAIAFIPLAHSQQVIPIGALSPNISPYTAPPRANIHFVWGTNGSVGSTFMVEVWAYNISASDGMEGYSLGFYFNPTLLQVESVTNGSVMDPYTAAEFVYIPGTINNTGGYVTVYTWALYSTASPYPITAPNKWVDLMHVTFEVNPALTQAQVTPVIGVPQQMMAFTTNPNIVLEQILFVDAYSNDITPYGHITNGTITYTLPLPKALPISSGITKSTSYAGYSCTFSVTWKDTITSLSKYIFSFDNGVGSFTNSTAVAFTSNPQTVSVTKTLNTNVGAIIRYIWYANDSSNYWNSTGIQTFVTTGPPPTYSGITYSTTTAGTSCVFSITCNDKVGLSKYIFSFDNGVGIFTNNTAVSFTSTPQTVSVTKTLTATVGATIRFRWFFNDTLGNWNSTGVQSFTTTLISASILPTSVTLDLGQSQTFTSTVTGSSPPFSLQWYLNGIAVIGANSSTWTFKPPSPGTYSVYLKVKDAIGEVATSNTATMFVNPLPTALVTPASVTLDIGEPWTFIASVFNGTPPYSSYQWYIDGSPVINATGTTWTYTPFVLVNRTVYITAMDSRGMECTSNTVLVTVSSALNPSISPLSAVMDLGKSQIYTAGVSGGTPPYTYQWYKWFPSGSEPFAGANKTTFDFTPSFAGLNLIYVEITDKLGQEVDIGAEATVNPPVSVSASPSSATIDAGQSQTFTSTISGGTSPYSYQWYVNGSPVLGANSSSWTFAPEAAGTYKVSVNATDVFGMSALSSTAILIANPTPTILVSPASVALDIGESWTFIASISNGTPPYSSFQWYMDGSPIIGATNSTWTYTALLLLNRTIYVTAADSFNFECTSNLVSVTVTNAMNPKISPPSAVMDLSQSHEYVVSVSGGTSPYSYQWYQWLPSGSKPFASATNATFTFTPTTIGLNIIYVVITDSNGVKVDWGATATVNPQPSAIVSPKSVTMDVGMSQLFTSIAVNGTPPYTYQWYIDGSPVLAATNDTWTYTPKLSSVGVHEIYLILTDSVNFAARSNNVTVTVNPPLVPKISPTSMAIDLGTPATLTSNTTGGTPPYSYQWYVNGILNSSATKISFTFRPTSTGTYSVSLTITDSVGFVATSSIAPVVVNPIPTVTISPASTSLQLGQNQTFNATVVGGTSPYFYQWYINGVLTNQTAVPTFTFTVHNISTYYKVYVIVIDASGLHAVSNTAIINGHDVAVTEVVPVDNVKVGALKTVFGQGYPIGINITAADPGYYSETFTITAYVNATAIVSGSITLASGGIKTLTLATTANLAYGHYNISAYATPVAGEVNLANNQVSNKTTKITVTIPGDVNGDGVVDLLDLTMITGHWLQFVPPAPANADVNGDGRINLLDLTLATSHWLEKTKL